MIRLFVTPSCSSSIKAKKWFKEHRIPFQEINLLHHKISLADLKAILKLTENGFEDIISTKSDYYRQNPLDFEKLSFNDLANIIIENPRILRRPLILGEERLQIGYNDEDIREFVPRDLRQKVMCRECDIFEDACEYQKLLQSYFAEIKAELKKEIA